MLTWWGQAFWSWGYFPLSLENFASISYLQTGLYLTLVLIRLISRELIPIHTFDNYIINIVVVCTTHGGVGGWGWAVSGALSMPLKPMILGVKIAVMAQGTFLYSLVQEFPGCPHSWWWADRAAAVKKCRRSLSKDLPSLPGEMLCPEALTHGSTWALDAALPTQSYLGAAFPTRPRACSSTWGCWLWLTLLIVPGLAQLSLPGFQGRLVREGDPTPPSPLPGLLMLVLHLRALHSPALWQHRVTAWWAGALGRCCSKPSSKTKGSCGCFAGRATLQAPWQALFVESAS